nr:putative ribonuclease H-like domain-containing protein [Tanacetum cinerariifolium]
MPDLEDTADTEIFSGAYVHEVEGAKANFNNLELTTVVSPIPTTRIHKDHPKEKIIGDPFSALKTRRITKTSQEHAMVIQALQDPSWIEAMQDELLPFNLLKMDVKSAFLYGTIDEEVYVCQPPGFEDYNVEKALYGLHQAHRSWYKTLSTYLLGNRFRKGIIDKTLFIKKDKGDILLV